jgi:hypothetical protein
MLTLTSKGIRESLERAKEANPKLFEQPRGLSVPVPPPPADLPSTPGVADSAERAAHRAGLVAQVRHQQEELPVAVADQAFRGALAGSLAGLGFLLLKNLFSASQSPRHHFQYRELRDDRNCRDSDGSGDFESCESSEGYGECDDE